MFTQSNSNQTNVTSKFHLKFGSIRIQHCFFIRIATRCLYGGPSRFHPRINTFLFGAHANKMQIGPFGLRVLQFSTNVSYSILFDFLNCRSLCFGNSVICNKRIAMRALFHFGCCPLHLARWLSTLCAGLPLAISATHQLHTYTHHLMVLTIADYAIIKA